MTQYAASGGASPPWNSRSRSGADPDRDNVAAMSGTSTEQANLRVVLNRIVHAASEQAGAEFGALALVSPRGELSGFISIGVADEPGDVVALPPSLGVVEAIISYPTPLRSTDAAEASAFGFPSSYPWVNSFLGVPVVAGDEVLGSLYVGNHVSGGFSDRDERVLVELAAAAALAIDHGRLSEEAERRRDWAETSAELASALLTSADDEAIDLFVDRLLHLVDADFVGVFQVSQVTGVLVASTVRGVEEDNFEGAVLAMSESFARGVFEGKHPLLMDDGIDPALGIAHETSFGPAMVVPLLAPSRAEAVLLVARVQGSREFSVTDLELTADFSQLATIAMELAAPRSPC
jgi:GAF domain-containing protein